MAPPQCCGGAAPRPPRHSGASSPSLPVSWPKTRISHSQRSDGRGGVEKRFAGTQLKLAQGSGTSGPSKAAELQALHMEDKADVLPAENGAENLIQFVQREGVGHRDDADDHRTHVAKNSSKNQSLEGGACAHSFTLPAPSRPDPRVAAALRKGRRVRTVPVPLWV